MYKKAHSMLRITVCKIYIGVDNHSDVYDADILRYTDSSLVQSMAGHFSSTSHYGVIKSKNFPNQTPLSAEAMMKWL